MVFKLQFVAANLNQYFLGQFLKIQIPNLTLALWIIAVEEEEKMHTLNLLERLKWLEIKNKLANKGLAQQ
jgi:hypothetical protein